MKVTVRPAEGHEIKFGALFQDYQYASGMFIAADHHGCRAYSDRRHVGLCFRCKELYGNDHLEIFQAGRHWFDWNATVYGNRTDNDQANPTITVSPRGGGVCTLANPGNNISGCVGDRRGYLLDTVGIDVNNTTRFNVGDWRNALTYGFDAFQDDVEDLRQPRKLNITTPSGQRTVSGGFVQLKNTTRPGSKSSARFRYDRLRLGLGQWYRGRDRFSPKITVGVTRWRGSRPMSATPKVIAHRPSPRP